MLYTSVKNGILFISIEDKITNKTINSLTKEIDYLLYKQEVCYYAFNFNNLNNFSNKFLNVFKNKLVEIFLRCGSVVIYGLDSINKGIFGTRKNDLFYIEKEEDIFKILKL